MQRPIYLDYNATTPVAQEVADAIQPFLDEHFGNPDIRVFRWVASAED
ncbi:cysteine desulfurase IscS [mine drainage metagenome]|uniref:Cysteine desulfurase IscS n=1 Tax=mine drainage metagenome TaxID=410659 RepID=A0A1J5RSK5_9ZZZZ